MATVPEEVIKDATEKYNSKLYYRSTKLNYMADVKQYLEVNNIDDTLWTRKMVTEKIKEIKEMKRNDEFTSTEYYDVAFLNGEEILIVSDTCVQVLPYEEYFDVFLDLHYKFDHMNSHEMIQNLSTQYVIEEKFLSIFINSCNICSKTNASLMSFNDLVHIDILGMSHKPDNGFRYILIYIEVSTNFVLLRPLLNADKTEVAAELFKIFTDFGPPSAITATNQELLIKIMKTFKSTPIRYDIPIYRQATFHDMSGISILELEKWLAYSSNNNWAFGCYIVQQLLNSRGKESAKDKVFGKKHEKSLNIPYELQQVQISDNQNIVQSNENMPTLRAALEQNMTKNLITSTNRLSNSTNILNSINTITNETRLHVEEDLGIDYDAIKIESEDEGDIEEKLHCTIITNPIQNRSDICGVCTKKGVSALVKCSVCERNVHLLCAERSPVSGHEQTHSRIICSNCWYQFMVL